MVDHTHDPALQSWVLSAQAPGTDFPIQNLPHGVFNTPNDERWRGGVAIGDQILDLAALHEALEAGRAPRAAAVLERSAGAADAATRTALRAALRTALRAASQPTLNEFMARGRPAWRGLRHGLSALLASAQQAGSSGTPGTPAWAEELLPCLVPQSQARLRLPAHIGDYTDFYTSIHHATNIGRLFRPDNPLLPNYQWVPIGYHGRASSIVVSGTPIIRPKGQTLPPGASEPVFGACKRLDLELELGLFIGPGNRLGEPIPIDQAEDHLFGACLLNDWSARDIQGWEYQPLGPFLSKNFATTISPWIVTMEALAPFRLPFTRPEGDPQPLAYLDSTDQRAQGVLDIQLGVDLQTAEMRRASQLPVRIASSNYRHAYWTAAQLVSHHTVGGCNLRSGDLLGTGTLSGPEPHQGGALIELTRGGKEPLKLPNGEQRTFLQDGDQLGLSAWCERPGAVRIGFGSCVGEVVGQRDEDHGQSS